MESGKQDKIGLFLTEAFNRIWKVAEEFRADRMGISLDKAAFKKCQKAIVHYGNLEISRPNVSGRFHASCFAIPTAAVNIYFCFLKQMEAVESGKKSKDVDLVASCDMLKVVALQAWTQPLRNDATDKNVVQIERFRNHVWWVGGNGLAFRSLIPVAAMYRSIPMLDVLSEVAQRGIGRTSQNTYKDAFWTEGCTVDGAGWGHGMQCLVWGYPISGICTALDMLVAFRNTPWECRLSTDNVETLLGFIRGSNWFYYKGYLLPFFDRTTAQYDPDRKLIRSLVLVKNLLKNWSESFDTQQLEELRYFQKDAEKYVIDMEGYGEGMYNGTRYFFNNDKLMKKLGIEYRTCDCVGTIVHLAIDNVYAGHILIADVIKPHAAEAMKKLKAAGVNRLVMLTGDDDRVAQQVADEVGISEVHSKLLPADKVTQVESLLEQKQGKDALAFVGDGINDAPVLSRADIGIAMGSMGSDAAIEAADVVLMDDDPIKIAKAIQIAKKCLRIVYENIYFAIGVKLICLLLGAIGIANMWVAIFADVGVMVIAVLNAVRALFVKKL